MVPHIKKVLIAGKTSPFEIYASAWSRALSELEIEVIRFDWTDSWSSGIIGRIERRFMWGPALRRINHTLLNCAYDSKPDVVLIYAGLPVWPSTIEQLRSRFWVAGYHNDDPFGVFGKKSYFRIYKKAIPLYSSHHVYRQQNVEEYMELGVKHVRILMAYYLPWIDMPPPLTTKEQKTYAHDIVFVGHAEQDHRIEYVHKLIDAGLPLKIHGDNKYWKRYLPPHFYHQLRPFYPIYGLDYRKTLAESKICLCFFSKSNRDQYTRRVFEIPACGGFLMCQRSNIMQGLYEEGVEAEFFSCPEELIDKCNFYLANEQARQRVAQAGYLRCTTSGYDIRTRMKQWLADTSEFMNNSTFD